MKKRYMTAKAFYGKYDFEKYFFFIFPCEYLVNSRLSKAEAKAYWERKHKGREVTIVQTWEYGEVDEKWENH